MTLFVDKNSVLTLAAGAAATHYVGDLWTGTIGTDSGAPSGTPTSTVGRLEAGFSMQMNYYFFVQKPGPLYVGMSIKPQYQPYDGYCASATCNSQTCTNTYATFPMKMPPIVPQNPQPPFYACPGNSVAYTIELCPGGKLLNPSTGVAIHPNGNKKKCLDVRGASFKNGTPVQIYDCNNTPAQKWVIQRETTSIQVAGTNFCLDSSTTSGNHVKMKIWQCYAGIPAQTWIYSSNNNYIGRSGVSQCLDLTDGGLWNGNVVQTYQCSANNPNQVWTV
jgi:hypothetical protein